MKISNQTPAVDLIERMQEARETSGTDNASNFQVEQTSGTDAVQSTDALTSDLKVTAQRAIDGEYKSLEEIHGAVIDDIVNARFPDLQGAKRRKVVGDLKTTLTDDPEFSKQIDDMLVMAATELGK